MLRNFQISHVIGDVTDLPEVVKDLRLSFLKVVPGLLAHDNFLRDDYREFLTLVRLYLRDDTLDFSGFLACGALHHARWMAKCIYALKISLLSGKCRS